MRTIATPALYDPRAPGTPLGINDAMIEQLVSEFYSRVRADSLLGPIFNTIIADWDQHLSRMRDFWSSVVLMSGRYKGKPVLVHARLRGITPAHFHQWLGLFAETARETCPGDAAALFIDRAERIAASLQLGMFLDSTVPGGPARRPARRSPNTTEFRDGLSTT